MRPLIPLFALAPFSFGYMTGFYLYIMVAGYLWLNAFSEFAYNHTLTGLSAVASALAFLFPALFMSSPLRQIYVLSPKAVDRVLVLILVLSAVTIAVGASYNFMFVGIENIYEYREKLEFPRGLLYLFGITSNALLPFAFAVFVEKRAFWRAVAVLLLLVLFYPVTLTKTAFFAPAWLARRAGGIAVLRTEDHHHAHDAGARLRSALSCSVSTAPVSSASRRLHPISGWSISG